MKRMNPSSPDQEEDSFHIFYKKRKDSTKINVRSNYGFQVNKIRKIENVENESFLDEGEKISNLIPVEMEEAMLEDLLLIRKSADFTLGKSKRDEDFVFQRMCRLRRKLLLRQVKRRKSMAVFDLDETVMTASKNQVTDDLKLIRYFPKKDLMKFTKLSNQMEGKVVQNDKEEKKEKRDVVEGIVYDPVVDRRYAEQPMLRDVNFLPENLPMIDPGHVLPFSDFLLSNPDDFTYFLNSGIYDENMIEDYGYEMHHHHQMNMRTEPPTFEIPPEPIAKVPTKIEKPPPKMAERKTKEEKTIAGAVDKYLEITMKAKQETEICLKEFYQFNPNLIPKFRETLFGDENNRLKLGLIVSPYSQRSLKPFIHRDFETKTKKQIILKELNEYFHDMDDRFPLKSQAPIDYCYLKPIYLKQVNQLLANEFWQGIDISNNLIDPEHSIVAMYKKMVVGCGFITEEGYLTYIVVHDEWRGAKIAQFMLYHLIQTCPDKHITLHVSVNNPALLLYNKFGFKPEQYIIDFYSKYLPKGSHLSNHAFLMRLRR